jgi:hypothetical protein
VDGGIESDPDGALLHASVTRGDDAVRGFGGCVSVLSLPAAVDTEDVANGGTLNSFEVLREMVFGPDHHFL